LTDLIPTCRVSGAVRFDGIDVHAPTTDVINLRRRVGMIFQKPNPFPLSVWRNLELPLREHGVCDREQIAARIEATLRDVGLWEEVKGRLHASALAFSGGQQQRICLARALVLRPEVLLLDEPCSALDPLSTGVIEELLHRLRERHAVVLVTHNLAQARRVADHTAVLWDTGEGGTLIEHGETAAVFESPRHPLAAAYLSGRLG
jgi:phosphate transport system ATP-binding protein